MNIPLHTLIKNSDAIEKYKDRKVKIFHGARNCWLYDKSSFVSSKHLAKTFTLAEAIVETKCFVHPDYRIDFHFIDSLGEEKAKITDFDIEEVYTFTGAHFDKHDDLM